jgi:oxaloacetate decarboxylase alpha subunit
MKRIRRGGEEEMAKNDVLKIHDETLRDGTQSLWGMMMGHFMWQPVMKELGEAGFHSIDLPSNIASPQVSVRFFKEDPRISFRMLSEELGDTPSKIWVHPSQGAMHNIVGGYSNKTMHRLGCEVFKKITPQWNEAIFTCCAQDEVKNQFPVLFPIWREYGVEPIPFLSIGHSPRHNDEFYANALKEIDKYKPETVCIKDVDGLLTPERLRTLIPTFQQNCGEAEIMTHYHGMNGLNTYNTVVSMELGIRKITTCNPPLAYDSSHVSVFDTIKNAEEMGISHNMDLAKLESITDKLTRIGKAYGHPVDNHPIPFDLFTYKHQIPGGVISNTRTQLAQLGHADKLRAVLEEIPVMLKEMGYPIMITPFSQFIAAQAALNVISGERWGQILDDIVGFACGINGWEEAGVPYMDQNLRDKIMSLPQAKKIQNKAAEQIEELNSEPPLSKIKASYNLSSASDEDFFFIFVLHGDQELKKVTPGGPDTYKRWI